MHGRSEAGAGSLANGVKFRRDLGSGTVTLALLHRCCSSSVNLRVQVCRKNSGQTPPPCKHAIFIHPQLAGVVRFSATTPKYTPRPCTLVQAFTSLSQEYSTVGPSKSSAGFLFVLTMILSDHSSVRFQATNLCSMAMQTLSN